MKRTVTLSLIGSLLLAGCGNRDKLLYPENDLAVKVERKSVEEKRSLDNIVCALSGEFPQISGHNNPAVEEKINALLEERTAAVSRANIERCPEELKRLLVTGTEATDTTNVDFRLYSNEKGVLSIAYVSSQYLEGAAHPNNSIIGVTVDLRTGNEYTLENMFVPDFDFKAELNKRLIAMEQTQGLNAEGIVDIRNPKPAFYFSKGNLVLTDLFTVHAIQGAELRIPLSELKDAAEPTGPIAALLGM